jgi:hypothetical protein
MPVEEDYDARALALPIDYDESPERGNSPIWSRRSASFRRNGSPYSRQPQSRIRKFMDQCEQLNRKFMKQYDKLTPVKKALFIIGGITMFILTILFLVFNERIFKKLVPVAEKWREIPGGWLILWFLMFAVSFPPLIGHGSLLTIAGFVYGFPNGFVLSSALTSDYEN